MSNTTETNAVPSALASLPPDLLFAVAIIFGVVALVIGGGLILVALRPTSIKAGGKVDYSPRAKIEVTRTSKPLQDEDGSQ